MAIHWFNHDEVRSILDLSIVRQCTDDDGDGASDPEVLDECRTDAEDKCKGGVEGVYDSTDWDVDEDGDGISDNVPARLKLICKRQYAFNILSRRPDLAAQYLWLEESVDRDLQKIIEGVIVLPGETGTQRTISNNMVEDDLGELTQDGEPLPWSGYQ